MIHAYQSPTTILEAYFDRARPGGSPDSALVIGDELLRGGNRFDADPAMDQLGLPANTFTNCCTAPEIVSSYATATNTITSDPRFVNMNAGDCRLLNRSPCVNAGMNQGWMTGAFDLDGRIRIRYGTVDMGAYERIYDGVIYKFH